MAHCSAQRKSKENAKKGKSLVTIHWSANCYSPVVCTAWAPLVPVSRPKLSASTGQKKVQSRRNDGATSSNSTMGVIIAVKPYSHIRVRVHRSTEDILDYSEDPEAYCS